MKNSIEQIIKNLSVYLLVITFTIGLTTLLTLEQNNLYVKINNLKEQKNIIHTLKNLQKDDFELTLIQFNGKSTKLTFETDKLRKLDEYDYTGKYLFDNSNEFIADLNKLSTLTGSFNSAARKYYEKDTNTQLSKWELKEIELKNEKALDNSFYSINTHIDKMIFKNILYIEDKFHLLEKISIFAFVLVLLGTLWYRKRLKSINNDIRHLYGVGQSKADYVIFSVEADAIRLRMGRKQVVSDNPDMIDNVTQINNYKGMMASFNNKKGLKEHHVTSVTVFEIDNFSKQNRAFNQDFTQAVLKKIAFTISLHEQATDVMARTDFNQFTVIITRSTKDQAFKDVDIMRQSIAEIKFKSPDGDPTMITICGGFVVKANNKSLDDSLRQSKDILARVQENGKNSIGQAKDFANR